MRFYNLLRIGITWKGPEIIELWQSSSDNEKLYSSQEYLTTDGYFYRTHKHQILQTTVTTSEDEGYGIDEQNNISAIGTGSDEDDSLLVAYDCNSIISVWRQYLNVNNDYVIISTSRISSSTISHGLTLLCFVICLIEFYAEIMLMKKYE